MYAWQRTEKEVAKAVKGKPVPGSGRGNAKGDVTTQEYCIEVKKTNRRYYTLSIESLFKIKKQAKNKRPVFVIEFGDSNKRYLLLSEEDELPLDNELKFNWSDIVTVRLYSHSLEEGDQILVGKDVWVVTNPKELRS